MSLIQFGLEPDNWKPFDEVGSGVKEIRINIEDGNHRIMYLAKFPEAIYVLHCFKKKTRATSKKDKDLVATRYKDVVRGRMKT